jgi:2-polyprenyl-3-methyl-5-hydroxy-6-metoxy-1,4-benzoquinol methylase
MNSDLMVMIRDHLKANDAVQDFEVIDKFAPSNHFERDIVYASVDPEIYDQKLTSENWVKRWGKVYDISYDQPTDDASFNVDCWKSTYDGKNIAPQEMELWVSDIISAIKFGVDTDNKLRVLEIGVGSGLIFRRLQDVCYSYFGVDVSTSIIEKLKTEKSNKNFNINCETRFEAMAAHEIQASDVQHILDGGGFDLIIINSVIMYFPDSNYLQTCLDKFMNWLSPKGQLFLGDIKDFRKLALFRSSIENFKKTEPKQLAKLNILNSMNNENELLISSSFTLFLNEQYNNKFYAIPLSKKGFGNTEMNRYRFDIKIVRKSSLSIVNFTPTSVHNLSGFQGAIAKDECMIILNDLLDPRLVHDISYIEQLYGFSVLQANLEKTNDAGSPSDLVETLELAATNKYVVCLIPSFEQTYKITLLAFKENTGTTYLDVLYTYLESIKKDGHIKPTHYCNNPYLNTLNAKISKTLHAKMVQLVGLGAKDISILIGQDIRQPSGNLNYPNFANHLEFSHHLQSSLI